MSDNPVDSLSPDRWERIMSILSDALEISPENRPDFLDGVCDGDDTMRREIEELLAAHRHPAAILNKDPISIAAELHADEDPDKAMSRLVGKSVGPYRILEVLGRGGMGTVFLAERSDLERRVALKVVSDPLLLPQRRRRFLQERRILARLTHPGIGAIMDAGVTADGSPYFAMEYVPGVPITEYVRKRRLSLDQRLDLFADVCRAVQEAHRNLVVHRDLKPSNILVTEEGRVKLLDFGIAKLLQDEPEPSTLTRTGWSAMTLAYAAPEQVEGEDVTTATDVYALGVLLVEMLTGMHPFVREGMSASSLREAILYNEPPRPSALMIRREPSAEWPPGAARVRRAIRGDLDTICLHALSKEPQRRYASAGGLLADIDRFRKGLPVFARPDSLAYRARRFAGRHRPAVVATTAGVLLLVSLIAVYTVRLARERDRAQTAAEEAEQVSAFLVELFESADPYAGHADSLSVATLLDRGRARVDALQDQPVVQAKMMDVLGQVYSRLSRYEQAEPLLRDALAIRRRQLSPVSPELARSYLNLGGLHYHVGRYDSAAAAMEKALAIFDRAFPDDHPDIATTLDDLGIIHRVRGDYQRAESFQTRALVIRRRLYRQPHEDLAYSLNNLAVSEYFLGNYDLAESLYREALNVDLTLFGPDHPDVATDMANLGKLLEERADYADAESLLTRALDIRREALGPSHFETMLSMSQLGGLLRRAAKLTRAEDMLRDAVARQTELLGPDHPSVGTARSNLGLTLRDRGDLENAETELDTALRIYSAAFGENHAYTATTLCNLASVLARRGRTEEADLHFQRGLAVFAEVLPPGHWQLAYFRSEYAGALLEWTRLGEAEALLPNAERILARHFGPDHERTRDARRRLVKLYDLKGLPDVAERYR